MDIRFYRIRLYGTGNSGCENAFYTGEWAQKICNSLPAGGRYKDAEVCSAKTNRSIFLDAVCISTSDDDSCGGYFWKGLWDLEFVRLKRRKSHGDCCNDRSCRFEYLCPLFYHYLSDCLCPCGLQPTGTIKKPENTVPNEPIFLYMVLFVQEKFMPHNYSVSGIKVICHITT